MIATALTVAAAAAVAAARIPLVLDTDIGQDFDDTWSLSYLLTRSDVFDFKLALSATRNTTGRATLMAKYLDTVGRSDVAVGVGVETAFDGVFMGVGSQYPWIGDYSLAQYPGNVSLDGVGALIDVLSAASPQAPVWIVCIAPTPNIESLLLRAPQLAANARIIAMSGSIYLGYNGQPPPSAEYNVAENTTAAQAMYAAHWAAPMITAPVDTSELLQIQGVAYQAFYAAATSNNVSQVLCSTLLANYVVWYNNGGKSHGSTYPFSPSTASSPNYDLQAGYIAGCAADGQVYGFTNCTSFQFPFMITQPLYLSVDNRGFTVIDSNPAPSHPLFYPAVHWAGDAMNMTQALSAYLVSWLVRGVGAPAL